MISDADGLYLAALSFLDFRTQRLVLVRHTPEKIIILQPGLRQLYTVPGTDQQLDSQILFQPSDMFAHRLLGDIHLLPHLSKIQRFREAQKIFDIQFVDHILCLPFLFQSSEAFDPPGHLFLLPYADSVIIIRHKSRFWQYYAQNKIFNSKKGTGLTLSKYTSNPSTMLFKIYSTFFTTKRHLILSKAEKDDFNSYRINQSSHIDKHSRSIYNPIKPIYEVG